MKYLKLLSLFLLFSCSEKEISSCIKLDSRLEKIISDFIISSDKNNTSFLLDEDVKINVLLEKKEGENYHIWISYTYLCEKYLGTTNVNDYDIIISSISNETLDNFDLINTLGKRKCKPCEDFFNDDNTYTGFDPPAWVYSYDGKNINLVKEFKMKNVNR